MANFRSSLILSLAQPAQAEQSSRSVPLPASTGRIHSFFVFRFAQASWAKREREFACYLPFFAQAGQADWEFLSSALSLSAWLAGGNATFARCANWVRRRPLVDKSKVA